MTANRLGFINSSWECGMCHTKVCKSCKEMLTFEELADPRLHECDEDNLKNLKLIKSRTRPCPNCKVSIERIEGCRQMWCTQCRTAFDWRTGDIVIKNIHNPHYFEWKNSSNIENIENIENNDDECLDVDYFYNIHISVFDKCFKNINRDDYNKFMKYIQLIRGIKFYIMLTLNHYVNNHDDRELTIRKKYIKNEINEKTFKQYLYAIDKKKELKREMYMIFDMFTNTTVTYMIQLLFNNTKLPIYSHRLILTDDNIVKQCNMDKLKIILSNLVEYTNKSFLRINKLYKNMTYYIEPNTIELKRV